MSYHRSRRVNVVSLFIEDFGASILCEERQVIGPLVGPLDALHGCAPVKNAPRSGLIHANS